MEKILLSFVSTFGSATSQDTIGAVSIILIGLSLLIILYRIQKWIIKVGENMSVLREVVKTYNQQQGKSEEKVKEEENHCSYARKINTSTDDYSKILDKGECSIAANTGNKSETITFQLRSIAANTGFYSSVDSYAQKAISANTGDYSKTSSSSHRSISTNTGEYSNSNSYSPRTIASNTGDYSSSNSYGEKSSASNTGNYSSSYSYGMNSIATNTGDYAMAVSGEICSVASVTGEKSFARVKGDDSIALVSGINGKASGKLGCWLILTEREEWNGKTYPIKDIKVIKVDGTNIKPDTWYEIIDGEIKEIGKIKE
jgi:hypothetical protein